MKSFREMNRGRIGVVGAVVVVVALAVALNSGAIYRALTSATYTAAFSEAGGLKVGDEVRIGGYTVGQVKDVSLEGGHVTAEFTVEGPGNLGTLTGAGIKTATPLGTRFLGVFPSGGGHLPSGSEIPLERTNSPYSINQVLSQLTTQSGEIDTGQFSKALDTVSSTLQDAPPSLRKALDGVSSLSKAIAGQDSDLRKLLANADSVTGVFAERNQQLSRLFQDGNLLLNELNSRREVISQLLVNGKAMLDQLNGLVKDNEQQLGPVLEQLHGVLDMLNRDDQLIGSIIQGANTYAGSLGDDVGSGPWYVGYVPNIAPTNIAPLLPDVLKSLGP